jgi:hypothetical protein
MRGATDKGRRAREAEALKEQPVPVALGKRLRLDDDVAEPRAGRDVDLDAIESDALLLGERSRGCGTGGRRWS